MAATLPPEVLFNVDLRAGQSFTGQSLAEHHEDTASVLRHKGIPLSGIRLQQARIYL